jgi:site-specific DNA recombinase
MGKLARTRMVRAVSEGTPLRALIYARASADASNREKSVDDQAEECVEFCEDEGFEVVKVLRENKRSASRYATKDRPKFKEVLALMRSGTVDVLVTWENSRAQRDLEVYVLLRKICAEYKVLWAYGGDVYDLNDPADRKATAQDAVNAESESDTIHLRVSRGVRRRAKKGLWHGRIPYGYKREYDPDTGAPIRQVIIPEQAKVIREIVDKLLAGHTMESVAAALNARNVPCPRSGTAWSAGKVRNLATSESAAGFRLHNGRLLPGTWEAIIQPHERAVLVARIHDPRRRTNKDGTRVKHLLSGVLKCSVCGQGTSLARSNSKRKIPAYACRKRHLSRHQGRVDAYVTEAVLSMLESPDIAELLRIDHSDDVLQALDEAKDLRARLQSFYRSAAQGKISADGLAEVEADLLPKIEAAEERVKNVTLPPALFDIAGPEARRIWADLDIAQKREVIRTVMEPRLLPLGRGNYSRGDVGVDPGFRALRDVEASNTEPHALREDDAELPLAS